MLNSRSNHAPPRSLVLRGTLWLVAAAPGTSISPAGWPVPPQGKPLGQILRPPGEPQLVGKLEVLRADEVDGYKIGSALASCSHEDVSYDISRVGSITDNITGSQPTGMGV